MNPKGWDLPKLKTWLGHPATQEDEFFDLKEMVPPDNDGKCRLKKEFCGFANRTGGFLFFGVQNRTKNVVGVNEADGEFVTRLSQIVTTHVFPPTIRWSIYEHIPLGADNKCIYVVKVDESPYFEKPHVFYKEDDGGLCIPYRERGHSRLITDGAEIRRLFLKTNGFYPEYQVHILDILRGVKGKGAPDFTLIEASLLQGYKAYLRTAATPDSSKILSSLEVIEKKISENRKKFHMNVADGGVVEPAATDELEKLIDEFISQCSSPTS